MQVFSQQIPKLVKIEPGCIYARARVINISLFWEGRLYMSGFSCIKDRKRHCTFITKQKPDG